MQEIKNWIANNLIIGAFPKSKQIITGGEYSNCQVIINVSDEFYLGNSETMLQEGKLNYYFPMGEECDLMGLNSIYGAMQVLYTIYKFNPDWKILIHCQGGKNRSPTIKSAFYYMMTGEHEPDVLNEKGILMRNNRLLDNCERKRLPPLPQMELFLIKCKQAFDNIQKFRGGIFDWVMSESKLTSEEI